MSKVSVRGVRKRVVAQDVGMRVALGRVGEEMTALRGAIINLEERLEGIGDGQGKMAISLGEIERWRWSGFWQRLRWLFLGR